MSELITTTNNAATMSAVKEFGAAIAKSQMFGCENESQGIVFAMACLARGRDPLSIPEDYHLMHGRLTLRADAMLGRLSKAGGDYEILEHSANAAEIKIDFKGRKFHERFTWEEAQQEPFVYKGKKEEVESKLLAGKANELKLSSNYATPRRRMQHLWARVVSDGVRVVAPELVTGSYTPEEVADFSGLSPGGGGAARPVVVEQSAAPAESPLVAPVVDQLASQEQVQEIRDLFKLLEIPTESQFKAVSKRGAKQIDELTLAAADDLIGSLRQRALDHKPAQADSNDRMSVDEPMDSTLEGKIKAKLRECAQLPGGSDLPDRVRAKLAGRKIADLSYRDGQLLLGALTDNAMQLFFGAVLSGDKVEEPPY